MNASTFTFSYSKEWKSYRNRPSHIPIHKNTKSLKNKVVRSHQIRDFRIKVIFDIFLTLTIFDFFSTFLSGWNNYRFWSILTKTKNFLSDLVDPYKVSLLNRSGELIIKIAKVIKPQSWLFMYLANFVTRWNLTIYLDFFIRQTDNSVDSRMKKACTKTDKNWVSRNLLNFSSHFDRFMEI